MTKCLFGLAAALLLSGCATISAKAPALGQGDTSGFDPKGASVEVVYESPTADVRSERTEEIYTLLRDYGFQPAQNGKADFQLRVTEGVEASEPDSVLLMMLSSFSMLILPHTYTATADYGYELWAGENKVHGVETRTQKKQLFGLIGLPLLAVNATGSVSEKARVDSHRSVLSSWIEQGAFE